MDSINRCCSQNKFNFQLTGRQQYLAQHCVVHLVVKLTALHQPSLHRGSLMMVPSMNEGVLSTT